MDTKLIKINRNKPETVKIQSAARLIAKGKLVAFPTETVYGLGANALDAKAVKKIYIAKGRPSDNPMIVHIASQQELTQLAAEVPEKARILAREFWPGPLTIVLKKKQIVPDVVTAGLDSVAIRMPSNKIARALIKAAGTPIAAPSANLSGKPSPTIAQHVLDDLNGRIPLIIDGGSTDIGLESTVIDLSTKTPTLLRPGRITLEQLRRALGKVELSSSVTGKKNKIQAAKSPGMKYRHYSPKAQVFLVSGRSASETRKNIFRIASKLKGEGKNVAIIASKFVSGTNTLVRVSQAALAKNLFEDFRRLDKQGVEVIIVQAVKEKELGLALMNRLKKAASRRIGC